MVRWIVDVVAVVVLGAAVLVSCDRTPAGAPGSQASPTVTAAAGALATPAGTAYPAATVAYPPPAAPEAYPSPGSGSAVPTQPSMAYPYPSPEPGR